MLDMMVHQKYATPREVRVSPDCLDILHKMLTPDPAKRIKLESIMTHAWFTTSLPAQAATMNAEYLRAPLPADYPTVEHIHEVLEGAKRKGRSDKSLVNEGIEGEDESVCADFEQISLETNDAAVGKFISDHKEGGRR